MYVCCVCVERGLGHLKLELLRVVVGDQSPPSGVKEMGRDLGGRGGWSCGQREEEQLVKCMYHLETQPLDGTHRIVQK